VNELSIGANLGRIVAVTGDVALARIQDEEHQLRRVADVLRIAPAEVPDRVEKLLEQVKQLGDELAAARAKEATAEAEQLAARAVDGVVAERRDLAPDDLRRLALATRDRLGAGVVALVGVAPDGKKAGLAVAISSDLVERGASAAAIAAPAARALGGGTAKNAEVVQGGGPNVAAVEEALALVRKQADDAVAG
jgi:alanyl-tRNA synthetase